MARALSTMEDQVIDAIASWGGWIAAIVVGWFGWRGNKRKSDVDQSGVVLASWQNLLATHQTDMAAMRSEFAAYKETSAREFAAYKAEATAEISGLRERIRVLEEDVQKKDRYIAGLERQIAQNSQSTAVMLGRVTAEASETVTKRGK